jgi:hypothetical protein
VLDADELGADAIGMLTQLGREPISERSSYATLESGSASRSTLQASFWGRKAAPTVTSR